jgi:hypothetical protein
MSLTVSDIQKRIAALVDQEDGAPTAGGDDWNLRLSYINMAQREWAESANWNCLYREYNSITSHASTANATIAMPIDFRMLAGFPKIVPDGVNTYEYSEIRPQEKDQYLDTDRYCYVLGNGSAYNLIINPATLSSGASIFVPYLSTPSALASPTDVSPITNPDYLVKRSIAMLWEAREDERFPQAKTEADKVLARMLEINNSFFDQASYGQVKNIEQTRYKFRIGRD